MFRGGARLALATSVAVAAAAVGIGMAAGGSSPVHGRGPLAAAVGALPASTLNANFTDWDSILRTRTVAEAMERDLTTRSVIVDWQDDLDDVLGVRLRDVAWEMYGQGGFGEAAVVRLKRSMPSVTHLRKMGYRPEKGVWVNTRTESLVAAVARLPRDNVLVISALTGSVASVRATVRGRHPSLAGVRGVADVAGALSGVQTAFIQASGLGCQTTAVDVDAETERQVAAAQERSGQVVPYSVLGRGLRDSATDQQRFRMAMTFSSVQVAAKQARIRADLSVGPFLGRSGNMADVLRLRSAGSDGTTTVLGYDHPADSEYLMTGHGPLLPASC